MSSWNVNANIVIGRPFTKGDKILFGGESVKRYATASIGKILIDLGIAKSWSEIKGGFWKDYEIPKGYSELYLDGQKLQKGTWEEKTNWSGFRPHRITILNLL